MDSRQRKQAAALGVLGVVLVAIVIWQFGQGASGPARTPTAAERAAARPPAVPRGRRAAAATAVDPAALEVRLAALDAVAPEPSEASRDPFRFRPVAAPPPPSALPGGRPGGPGQGGMVAPPPGVPAEPSGPPVAPPPPPISLKFIGTVTQGDAGRMAVLSDGKFVFHGREGDIIEGRYRVVKIGEESIQMEYVDGRGRQTIRLSGS